MTEPESAFVRYTSNVLLCVSALGNITVNNTVVVGRAKLAWFGTVRFTADYIPFFQQSKRVLTTTEIITSCLNGNQKLNYFGNCSCIVFLTCTNVSNGDMWINVELNTNAEFVNLTCFELTFTSDNPTSSFLPVQVPVFWRGPHWSRDCHDDSVHSQKVCGPCSGGTLCGVPNQAPQSRQCVHAPHSGNVSMSIFSFFLHDFQQPTKASRPNTHYTFQSGVR